jgi:thymidylate kinase
MQDNINNRLIRYNTRMNTSKHIFRAVLTGGPCAGKTTSIPYIKSAFEKRGWKVLFVSETATELIRSGVTREACVTPITFQRCVSSMQLAREDEYISMANLLPDERILILFDRGILDGKSYISSEEFDTILEEIGLSEDDVLSRYDAVFHLETTAKGAVENYKSIDNGGRSELPELAAELDNRLQEIWGKHEHFIVLDNSTDFERKVQRLIDAILYELH